MAQPAGCLTRILALIGLVSILLFAWIEGPDLRERFGREGPAPANGVTVSSETVSELLERVQGVVDGDVDEVRFSDAEVQSLLHHFSDLLPAGASEPTIRFEGREVRLGLRVAISELPPAALLERLRSILPDTVPGGFRGTVFGVGDGAAVFLVRRVDVSGVPLPRSLVPHILEYLGAGNRDDLPREALSLPLPTGVRTIYVDDDHLILAGDP